MGFTQSKDLDCYEEGKKRWVFAEVKIWIVIKKEEKRWGLDEVKI